MQHVKMVFDQMRAHNLFIKCSKCVFGNTSVTYLGHIISAVGVAMDPAKVAAVSWPIPRSLHTLRGFLGLTSYCRKFITHYGDIARPLTALLKKDAFRWTQEAEHAFQQLKQALTSAPLLQLPDFEKNFIVKCDTSGSRFGVVLHQGNVPIAFFS
jgi:hypothetical protein